MLGSLRALEKIEGDSTCLAGLPGVNVWHEDFDMSTPVKTKSYLRLVANFG